MQEAKRTPMHTPRPLIAIIGFFVVQAVSAFTLPMQIYAQQGEAEVSVAQGVLAYEQHRYSEALPFFMMGAEQNPVMLARTIIPGSRIWP